MKTLIVKLGASGDVVRTTCLLRVLKGEIHWLTSDANAVLLRGVPQIERLAVWQDRNVLQSDRYDLVINLEDAVETAAFINTLKYRELFGAYLDTSQSLRYSESSRAWFDISLISTYGRKKADEMKLMNRRTYQDMIFSGLGYTFNGESYCLPEAVSQSLHGDIAIAQECGAQWPMKNWAYYNELKVFLEGRGYTVNYLPQRSTILEHIGDVRNHRYLVSGDSLPMHIALGSGISCLTIFTCTSPWEIYHYNLQQQMISPLLDEFFYKRNYDKRATTCIALDEVCRKVLDHICTNASGVKTCGGVFPAR